MGITQGDVRQVFGWRPKRGMDRHKWEGSPGGAYVSELEGKACARSQVRARGPAQVGGFWVKKASGLWQILGMGVGVVEGIPWVYRGRCAQGRGECYRYGGRRVYKCGVRGCSAGRAHRPTEVVATRAYFIVQVDVSILFSERHLEQVIGLVSMFRV